MDGGWTVGILTWIAILGGAAAYAFGVMRAMKPDVPANPDMRRILESQARDAEIRARETHSTEGTTLDQWLDAFAKRIVEVWGGSRDEARRWGREYLELCGMRFPDAAYDWSLSGACEMADEYMRECGEEFGANA